MLRSTSGMHRRLTCLVHYVTASSRRMLCHMSRTCAYAKPPRGRRGTRTDIGTETGSGERKRWLLRILADRHRLRPSGSMRERCLCQGLTRNPPEITRVKDSPRARRPAANLRRPAANLSFSRHKRPRALRSPHGVPRPGVAGPQLCVV